MSGRYRLILLVHFCPLVWNHSFAFSIVYIGVEHLSFQDFDFCYLSGLLYCKTEELWSYEFLSFATVLNISIVIRVDEKKWF